MSALLVILALLLGFFIGALACFRHVTRAVVDEMLDAAQESGANFDAFISHLAHSKHDLVRRLFASSYRDLVKK